MEIVVNADLGGITRPGPAEFEGYVVAIELPDGTITPFDQLHETDLHDLSAQLAQLPDVQRGEVRIYRDGLEVSTSSLSITVKNAFLIKASEWTDYVQEIAANTSTAETIFSIDLNSFLSIEDNIQILRWTSFRHN